MIIYRPADSFMLFFFSYHIKWPRFEKLDPPGLVFHTWCDIIYIYLYHRALQDTERCFFFLNFSATSLPAREAWRHKKKKKKAPEVSEAPKPSSLVRLALNSTSRLEEACSTKRRMTEHSRHITHEETGRLIGGLITASGRVWLVQRGRGK